MGRMHSQGKGISGSALPFRRKPPKWTTITPAAVVELIIKLAKKGSHNSLNTASQRFSLIRFVSKSNRCYFERSTRYSTSQVLNRQEDP